MRLVLVLALAASVAACGTDPRGTRLALQTREAEPAANACDGALSAPFRIARSGDAMAFVDVASGEPVSIVWPFGFAAWLEYGVPLLYASDGGVVGREGDVLDTIGGSAGEDGFRVCSIGVRTYQ